MSSAGRLAPPGERRSGQASGQREMWAAAPLLFRRCILLAPPHLTRWLMDQGSSRKVIKLIYERLAGYLVPRVARVTQSTQERERKLIRWCDDNLRQLEVGRTDAA